jgi:hypothetical protein
LPSANWTPNKIPGVPGVRSARGTRGTPSENSGILSAGSCKSFIFKRIAGRGTPGTRIFGMFRVFSRRKTFLNRRQPIRSWSLASFQNAGLNMIEALPTAAGNADTFRRMPRVFGLKQLSFGEGLGNRSWIKARARLAPSAGREVKIPALAGLFAIARQIENFSRDSISVRIRRRRFPRRQKARCPVRRNKVADRANSIADLGRFDTPARREPFVKAYFCGLRRFARLPWQDGFYNCNSPAAATNPNRCATRCT